MNLLKKKSVLFIFTVVFFSLNLPLIGDESPGRTPGYAEARPRPRESDELVVVFSRANVELDFRRSYMASEAQLFTAIYEGLFSYHPITMEPIPAAASAWTVSEDQRVWTFTIRENARFNNGDPLRAEDFRASWLSLLEPERNAPYSSLFDIINGLFNIHGNSSGFRVRHKASWS